MADLSPNLETRWLPIRNDSGESIPPFGLVEPTEVVTINRQKFQTVIKPSANSLDGLMFNGPFLVGANVFGTATRDFPNFVQYNTSDGTPVNDEIWGSVGGSFELGKSQFGFQIIGGVTNGIVEVILAGGGASAGGGCGDLLAGWSPNDVADSDDRRCAGTADVTLTSDDLMYAGTNLVNRGLGFIGLNSWEFINDTVALNESALWVDDSPDFIDVTQDFTIRLLWNSRVTSHAIVKSLLDIRGGVFVNLTDGGPGSETLRIELFDGTSTTTLTFAGISNFLDAVWYVFYLRWDQATRVMTVNAMAPESQRFVTANENIAALSNDIDASNALGILLAGNSAFADSGMAGRMDGLATWQKRLADCEIDGDYNCGELSTLPAPNQFFTGPGGLHRKPAYISAATEPTLSVGEQTIWRDTANSETFYMFNDPASGQAKVELTV